MLAFPRLLVWKCLWRRFSATRPQERSTRVTTLERGNQKNMRLSDASAGLGYFSVQTGNPDRDYLNLGGSFSAALPNGGGAFIRYETRLSQTYISEHIVEGGVRLTF
ncbi:MAG: hypothetical protein NTX45_08380 [Proteobacteria bacterium]|nr:hypothetical protein [Pseudomonadota bacterium]